MLVAYNNSQWARIISEIQIMMLVVFFFQLGLFSPDACLLRECTNGEICCDILCYLNPYSISFLRHYVNFLPTKITYFV